MHSHTALRDTITFSSHVYLQPRGDSRLNESSYCTSARGFRCWVSITAGLSWQIRPVLSCFEPLWVHTILCLFFLTYAHFESGALRVDPTRFRLLRLSSNLQCFSTLPTNTCPYYIFFPLGIVCAGCTHVAFYNSSARDDRCTSISFPLMSWSFWCIQRLEHRGM